MRKRIELNITLDLDPVPGAFHTGQSALDIVTEILESRLGHYHPEVAFTREFETSIYVDRAILVRDEHFRAGGHFFMNQQAVVGWYCVRSSDPMMKDLYLPPRNFRRCFQWVEEESPNQFRLVKEIV